MDAALAAAITAAGQPAERTNRLAALGVNTRIGVLALQSSFAEGPISDAEVVAQVTVLRDGTNANWPDAPAGSIALRSIIISVRASMKAPAPVAAPATSAKTLPAERIKQAYDRAAHLNRLAVDGHLRLEAGQLASIDTAAKTAQLHVIPLTAVSLQVKKDAMKAEPIGDVGSDFSLVPKSSAQTLTPTVAIQKYAHLCQAFFQRAHGYCAVLAFDAQRERPVGAPPLQYSGQPVSVVVRDFGVTLTAAELAAGATDASRVDVVPFCTFNAWMRYFMRLTQVAASPVETVRVAELVEVDRRALLWVADAVLKGSTFDHAVELSLGATCPEWLVIASLAPAPAAAAAGEEEKAGIKRNRSADDGAAASLTVKEHKALQHQLHQRDEQLASARRKLDRVGNGRGRGGGGRSGSGRGSGDDYRRDGGGQYDNNHNQGGDRRDGGRQASYSYNR